MGKSVTTRMKRVTFVEKTAGEVGPNTSFPVQVTLDQLAEIYYRVKDSRMSGSVHNPDSTLSHFFNGSPSLTHKAESELYTTTYPAWLTTVKRAYFVSDVLLRADYFGAGYTRTSAYDFALDEETTQDYFDLKDDNEMAIYLPEIWGNGGFGIVTGLTHIFTGGSADQNDTGSIPSIYCHYEESPGFYVAPASAQVLFGNVVAWVDVNNSGNPIDPSNQLYLQVDFSSEGFDSYSSVATGQATGLSLSIILSSGSLDIPLFFRVSGLPPISFSGSGFVLEAKEWWPYAKDSPAVPVWDADTGLKL